MVSGMTTTAVAHRGDSEIARENTLLAFCSAVQAGADWVELDIRTTADGCSIVLHDETFERLWGLPRRADELTLAEVAEIGEDELRVPTLVQSLDLVAASNDEWGRGSGVLVDTVAVDDALAAAEVIAAHPLTSGDAPRLGVRWCGDTDAMLAVRERHPGAELAYNHPGGPLPADLLARLRPWAVNVEWTLVTAELVNEVHGLGLELTCWTVDRADAMSRLMALGVDAITSDRLRLLLEVLRGEGAERA